MNKPLSLLALIAAAASAAAQAPVRVVTTTQDLASLAQAVGGRHVQVRALVVGARDPHRMEARPSYMALVANAQLFLAVGLDLEVGYEGPILEGARNRRVMPGQPGHAYAGSWVPVLEKPTGSVSRADGDVHPGGNPHVWLDPYNGRLIASGIAGRLSQIDPARAPDYRANLAAFEGRIDRAMFGDALVARFGGVRLWEWQRSGQLETRLREQDALRQLGGWANTMAPHRGQPIITYHRSWSYFAHRFGLKVVAELEPKPGLDPTPGHLASVVRTAQAQSVKLILQESYFRRRDADFVASRSGAQVVVAPAGVGHDPAAKDYITLFDTIVSRVGSALRR
jgi:zinc/manganese transport system substrate-binding protein